jgi:hypothetical protein
MFTLSLTLSHYMERGLSGGLALSPLVGESLKRGGTWYIITFQSAISPSPYTFASM